MFISIHNLFRKLILLSAIVVFIDIDGNPLSAEEHESGISYTGVPLPSYNSDDGVGFGARIFATKYDVDFAPYRWQIWAQVYKTSKKYESHIFNMDFIEKSVFPFRMNFSGGFLRHQNMPYFGFGNDQDLTKNKKIVKGEIPLPENRPNSPDIYQLDIQNLAITDNRFGEDVSLNQNGGFNPGRRILRERQNKYFYYDHVSPFLQSSFENWIGKSRFKWWFALRSTLYRIDTYQGDKENSEGEANTETLLDKDRPTGYEAKERPRFVNYLRMALSYDSRPKIREKNPNSGILADIHIALSGKAGGSDYSFYKTTLSWRQYIDATPEFLRKNGKELIFAYRFIGQKTTGDAPFFEMSRINTKESSESIFGLGGAQGVRGYPMNLFADRVMVLGNFESRFTFARTSPLGGMDWIFLLYYDAGRSSELIREITTDGFHDARGCGIRVVWQRNTVINISYGASKYERFTAFTFGHLF